MGPGAPGAGVLAAVIGAEQPPVRAAAVVAGHLVGAAGRPGLTQRVHAVTLPQLHTHTLLLQLACTHTRANTHTHTHRHTRRTNVTFVPVWLNKCLEQRTTGLGLAVTLSHIESSIKD